MVRRILCLALMAALLIVPLAAAEGAAVRVAALKGPTAMGMVKMMKEKTDAYEFTLVADPTEIAPLVLQGKVDIAAIPANLAAVLYNKTEGGVKVLNVNTLGVLYILARGDDIQTVADLKGRTLYASGKGATPEYALDYILKGNGLDPEKDLTIEFKTVHQECLAALLQDENAAALLPQPFATVAQIQAKQQDAPVDLNIVLDLNEEWNALQAGVESPSTLITGVAIARADFIEQNPDAVKQFMADYADSVAFVNDDNAAAAQLIGEFDIFQAGPAEKALPYCKIVFIAGEEMRTALGGYLAELFNQDPTAVGGAVPNEDFYYAAE